MAMHPRLTPIKSSLSDFLRLLTDLESDTRPCDFAGTDSNTTGTRGWDGVRLTTPVHLVAEHSDEQTKSLLPRNTTNATQALNKEAAGAKLTRGGHGTHLVYDVA
jgi:hypothetical protein